MQETDIIIAIFAKFMYFYGCKRG